MTDEAKNGGGSGSRVDRGVRPSLLTEKELLDIVDQLIRDRAYNRPAAIAIAMAVGAAVEAEVRERCAKLCEWLPIGTGLQGKTFAEAIRGEGMGGKMAEGFRA